MRRVFCVSLLLGLAVAACGGDDGSRATEANTPDDVTPAATVAPNSTAAAGQALEVSFTKVAAGFERPTFVTHAGDGSGRLFVVEKPGRIRVVQDGRVVTDPFLDITDLVTDDGNEQGMLGLAFHPKFRENGRFFVTYTAAKDGANTLAEYRAGNGNRADASSGRVLIAIPDRRSNHNGGMVAFGRDGYLYFSTGDGGGAGDPDRTAQDTGALLGKIVRIDVDTRPGEVSIPPDNPFAKTANGRPEIWALGLRNPWRFSFDRETADLWIGDVGQNAEEEVDFQPAASKGGENYGWSVVEGSRCFRPSSGCDRTGFVAPVHTYGRDDGCSITGGYVYRGKAIAGLRGRYLFTDYCDARLRTLRQEGGRWVAEDVGRTPGSISSFGEDESGELYVLGDRDGALYRLTAGR